MSTNQDEERQLIKELVKTGRMLVDEIIRERCERRFGYMLPAFRSDLLKVEKMISNKSWQARAAQEPRPQDMGDWIPLHRSMNIECCTCGAKHLFEFRVENDEPQWRATPIMEPRPVSGEPFGWWDTFNAYLYRTKADADKAAAGGNMIIPLFTASERGQEWVSVEERLPTLSEFVLIFSPELDAELDCSMRVAWLSPGGWEDFVEHVSEKVTHWMPLPVLPAEKGRE